MKRIFNRNLCLIWYFGIYCDCVFFFFFQAEDGIRDLTVTGVQTCALPILRGCPGPRRPDRRGSPGSSPPGRPLEEDNPPSQEMTPAVPACTGGEGPAHLP